MKKNSLIYKLLVVVGVIISGCSTSPDGPENLERTWNEGKVYIPGSRTPQTVKSFKSNQRYPVVLYFHGCTGISTINDIPWARLLASNGYLVVMPDSFARTNKFPECDVKTLRRPTVDDGWRRVNEIIFAVEKIKQTDWSDGTIYLMGHSQGAWALTRYPGHDVDGIVLSSLVSCGWSMDISRTTPVLRLGYSNDPWNTTSPAVCDTRWVHENFQMKIIDGAEHETYYSRQFQQDVLEFLRNLQQNRNTETSSDNRD